jgi:hypothetical protein
MFMFYGIGFILGLAGRETRHGLSGMRTIWISN